MTDSRLKIGYIPLVDAAALLVAVDFGFAAREGLTIELIREVSWSNVRDKLNIGLFDAAHLLSPVAIASSLGIGHVRVPLIAPFILGLNGNAITVSPRLYAQLSATTDGDLTDPKVSARTLARLVDMRKSSGADPITFGMTFPFSNHNYQLRFWMAAGGIDPDEDVRLVVLPPPYMVESLVNGHVDGFCVGAPWSSAAAETGVGRILHFGCDIMANVSEKVLAVREQWANKHPGPLKALIRALAQASAFVENAENLITVADAIGQRLGVAGALVARTLAGNPVIAKDKTTRPNDNYIVIGRNGTDRPDQVQAAWIYAQIVRWGQAALTQDLRTRAQDVFKPEIYDAVMGHAPHPEHAVPHDRIGAFAGPEFDPTDIASYLMAWSTKRPSRLRLNIVQ